ncbi:hypothetical protein J3458_005062 [Metarhizium acridum]|uniref:Uncharacterized protein n=1 Tax=Metarhizium acridum (strain CQMa 102) TaxID=655827 RepID=E9DR69_METAQ|nr:uncharacterized protein MAC_00238 [Metarhizium acridum CQMa 102]EFY93747.1 hypothetical protein MAC_00238 [Metarhizium acridum CQMa 102]KAG8417567.1 hypothetical protein J3458_005062 [Metarhizium acridum]
MCLIADSETASLAPSNPSITASRSYSSMRTPGYIDLLDAQGGLRPYDFRARVQAAGVRDYGEDVAERNMGENGVDVRSAAAKRFYEQKKRTSVTTLSNLSHVLDADASTCAGSEAGDMSHIDGSVYSSTRSLSRLSMEPRQEVSGVVAGLSTARENYKRAAKCSKLAPKETPEPRSSHRDQPLASEASHMQRYNNRSSSRGRSLSARHWISTEQPIAGKTRNDRWESRHLSPESRTRSISPPSVPRYRPGSSMTTMREEDNRPYSNSQSILRRDGFQNDNNEGRQKSDDEQSEYDIPSSNRIHLPYNLDVGQAAPLQYHPDWQVAIQRAVEESLAKLPLSADLKALLELSHSEIPLDDILQRVPLRHSSLHQGSIISTTPTTDFSDYASSHTGRPHSRHTATTSIDSSARIDVHHKKALNTQEDKSLAGDQCQSSPYLTPVEDEELLITATSTAPTSQSQMTRDVKKGTGDNGISEVEEYECLTSDYSDVDSFTEKRRQVLDDDETKLFNDGGFGDISNNLPGIASPRERKNCTVCIILANLQGLPVQTELCTHDGSMTRKQRLRALGYDYDSEESDTERDLGPVKGRSRTKKLTVGTNGGLRRLKLVDDRIDEDSEEERGEATSAKNRPELRRKPKFPNGRPGPVLRQEREAGNITDTD